MGGGGKVLPLLLLPVEIYQFGCTFRCFPPHQQCRMEVRLPVFKRPFKNIVWETVFICVPSQSSPVVCWWLCVCTQRGGHRPARMRFQLWNLVSLLQLDAFGVCESRRTRRVLNLSVLDSLHTSDSYIIYHTSHTDIPFESTGGGCDQRKPLHSKEIGVL